MKSKHWLALGALGLTASALIFRYATTLDSPVAGAVRGPMLQNVTTSAATIAMQFPRAQKISVQLRAANGKTARTFVRNADVRHEIPLSSLRPGARYNYSISADNQKFAGSFVTAPTDKKAPLRFAAWGDSGDGQSGQAILAGQIEKFKPDFLLHTGDLIYPRGQAKDYDAKFFKPYKNLLPHAPFYGCLGNHDIQTHNGAPFLGTFVFPRNGPKSLGDERNFSFTRGNAQFWILDTNISFNQMKNVLAPWIGSQLKNSRSVWKIVVFHQPPYSSGLHGGWERTRELLAPVLVSNGADVVLNGHDHNYERFAPKKRTTFLVTGAGGAKRYPKRRTESGSAKWNNAQFSFSAFEIQGQTLKSRQIGATGQVLDTWSIQK